MAAAPRARPLHSAIPGGPAEDGFRRAHRFVAARALARLGRGSLERVQRQERRTARCGAAAPAVGRAPVGAPQLAIFALGRADDPGLASPLGIRDTIIMLVAIKRSWKRPALGALCLV